MIPFVRKLKQLDQYGPYILFDDFLTPEECMKLHSLMHKEKMTEAKVSEQGVMNTSIRSTEVCALDYAEHTQWIFAKLEDAITQCNEHIYKFDLNGFNEAIQLMQYREGDFYDWHQDYANLQFSRRKLSFSVQLSDEKDYEGGELEFFKNGMVPKKKGTLIVFPSFMHHRVNKITRGLRRAVVGWVDGPAYR